MKRQAAIAIACTAVLGLGLSGCSGNKSSTSSTESSPAETTASATVSTSATAGASGPTVLIDGQNQNVTGTVVCTTAGGNTNIAIGEAATGIAAVLSDADVPVVSSVALGNVNGVSLAYTSSTGQGDAEASKDGNSYKITGTATGIDMANPTQPVNKPFEIDVTCP